jgi:DNA-binding transcriptional MocR family regulator
MIAAVETYLIPLGITLPQTKGEMVGGYFIYLRLPAPLHAEEVAVSARDDENTIIAPGPIFAVYGDEGAVDLTRNVRLCFSWEAEDKLAEGIQRLGRVIGRLQDKQCLEGSPSWRPSGESRVMMEQYR